LGLAKQCIAAWKEKKIVALKNTFLTLSLSEIGKKADIENQDSLEPLLTKMVCGKQNSNLPSEIHSQIIVVFALFSYFRQKQATCKYRSSKVGLPAAAW
jgi:hypothetical protein